MAKEKQQKIKKIAFDNRTYAVGKEYRYEDLTDVAQFDARASTSTEEDPEGEGTARNYVYLFDLIPNAEAKGALQSYRRKIDTFHEANWGPLDPGERAAIESRIRGLMEDIEEHGLQHPPLGPEGYHRAVAVVRLGWDLPYFRIMDPKTGKELEGSLMLG